MRTFSYIKDYNIIGTTIIGYIKQLELELKLLKDENILYYQALDLILQFEKKYPNLGYISALILNDLLKPENVEYCFNNGCYPFDASIIGMDFENDLNQIIKMEEQIKKYQLKNGNV